MGFKKTFVCLRLLLLLLSGSALCADAPVIVVILASQAMAYQKVSQSFESTIASARSDIQLHQVNLADLKDDASKLSKLRPDLVFALGSESVRKAHSSLHSSALLATMILGKSTLDDIPDATAITLDMPIHRQFNWHKKLLPQAKRIGILYNPEHNSSRIKQAQYAASKLGLEVIAVRVESPKQISSALKSLGQRVDSILAIPDKTVYSSSTVKAVLLFSFRNRIPLIGLSAAWVKAGALYALDWDYSDLGQQSAEVALKIINGTKAKKIKTDIPRTSIYQLNLKTAKHMKLDIKQELIDAAAKVYE